MSVNIFADTRQKDGEWKSVHDEFEGRGFKVSNVKLDVGDYMSDANEKISIDTKFSVSELAQNVCSKDHERFRREIKRANANGIRLVFLIVSNDVESLSDLKRWHSRFTNVNGSVLSKACATMERKYGVTFEFTSRENVGRRILEILGVV